MADSPYPIPRAIRETEILVGTGVAAYGPFGFKIFDTADVTVWRKGAGDDLFSEDDSATVTKVAGAGYDDFTVTFTAPIDSTVQFVVSGARLHERSVAVTKGGAISTDQLEKELSKQAVVLDELRRDADRGLKFDFGQAGGRIEAIPEGHFHKADAAGNLVDGGSAEDIRDAEEHAAIATEMAQQASASASKINLPDIVADTLLQAKPDGTGYDPVALTYVRGNHILTPYDRALSNPVSPLDPWDADVSVAIQELLGEVGSSWSVARQSFDAKANGGRRVWCCDSEVGLVGVKQPGVTIEDMEIFSRAAGKIALNLGDTSHPRVSNVFVYGDVTDTPAVGVYLGLADTGSGLRPTPALKAGVWGTRGKFSRANVVNFGSEVTDLGAGYHENVSRNPAAAIYLGMASGAAFEAYLPGLTSDLCTLPTSAAGLRSNIVHDLGLMHFAHRADFNLAITGIDRPSGSPLVIHFDAAALGNAGVANGNPVFFWGVGGTVELNGRWYQLAAVDTDAGTVELSGTDGDGFSAWTAGGIMNPRSGPALILEGAGAVTGRNGYLVTQGNAPVVFDLSFGGAIRDIDLHFQSETQAPVVAHFKLGSGAATIQRLSIKDLSAAQAYSDALFTKEGAGVLSIHGHTLDITSMGTVPPNGIWRDGAGGQSTINVVDADYKLPLSSIADIAVPTSGYAGFTGKITTMDDGRARTFTKPRSWIPALKFGGASEGMTYGSGGQMGWVEDVGEMQYAHFRIALAAKGSSTGNATIEGLPEPVGGSGAGNSAQVVFMNYASLASITTLMANAPAGQQIISLRSGGAASATSLTDANFTDASVIEGVVIYRRMD